MSFESAALYVAAAVIGAFVLWELTSEWRARQAAHRERQRRDAESDLDPRV